MKYNLKLEKNEETFAVKHITDYYNYGDKCKYFELINSILSKFENNIRDYNKLKTNDDSENIIIKKLLSVFLDKLRDETKNNQTGLFGGRQAFFTDGVNLCYKNLIKEEFVKTNPICARDLNGLKTRIQSDNGVWLVLNNKKLSKYIKKTTPKTKKPKTKKPKTKKPKTKPKKGSNSSSDSKKMGGFPRPLPSSTLIDPVRDHHGLW